MTTINDMLAPGDFDRLAALHATCMSGSMLSWFGQRFTTAAYRYFDRSPLENIFIHRKDGCIDGACILSLSPATITRRLVLHTGLLLWLPLHIFERRVLSAIFDFSAGVAIDCPEVVFIFSDPASRGLGHGAKLLAQCEAALRKCGESRYAIKTLDDDANPAIRFYIRHGFTERGRFVHSGARFRRMDKTL